MKNVHANALVQAIILGMHVCASYNSRCDSAAKDDSIEVSEPPGWLLCCYSISYYFQVRAEDADVLIMLIHIYSSLPRQRVLMMSEESKNLCLKDRGATCYFVMPLLVVILFLPLPALGKPLYLTGFVLGTLMNTWTPSLMYRLVRMWLSGVAFQFSSAFTMHQVLA